MRFPIGVGRTKLRPSTMDNHIQARWKWRTRNVPWYPRSGTRIDLAKFFGEVGLNCGVEVGTKKGEYAKILCEANSNLCLYCVDPWIAYSGITQERQDRRYAVAVETLQPYNVGIIKKTSMEAVNDFENGSLDFVYIDGNHRFEYAMMDLLHWPPKVRRGGIVAMHDYHPMGQDVTMTIEAYTRAKDIRPWYVTREPLPTAFWVKR